MSEAGPAYPSLGVVVPVFNESATIERAVREIAAVAGRYPAHAVVIAVDDGSADDSAAILKRVGAELDGVDVVRHTENSGYGAALRTGAMRAKALGLEYVAFMDSDLTNPPEDLLRMGRLAADGHPYIKASRFVAGGTMGAVPARRRVVSRTGNLVGGALFGAGIRDVTNGFRMVRTDLVTSWPLERRDFSVIVEELDWALRAGVPVVELPTTLTARADDQRPTAFVYSPGQILAYLRWPLGAARRRLGRKLKRL